MSKVIRSFLLPVALLGLSLLNMVACTTVDVVMGPNRERAFLVGCSEARSCYNKANEICPTGYKLVNSGNKVGGSVDMKTGSIYADSTTEILVSCSSKNTNAELTLDDEELTLE